MRGDSPDHHSVEGGCCGVAWGKQSYLATHHPSRLVTISTLSTLSTLSAVIWPDAVCSVSDGQLAADTHLVTRDGHWSTWRCASGQDLSSSSTVVQGARDQSCGLLNPPAVNFFPVRGHDKPAPAVLVIMWLCLSVTILRRQWRIFIKQIGIFALAAVTVTSPAANNRSQQQIILYQLNADLHQPHQPPTKLTNPRFNIAKYFNWQFNMFSC